MHDEVLTPEAKNNIHKIGAGDFIKDFYLAGGTGSAIQIGHRTSDDLDFFTNKKFNVIEIEKELNKIGNFKINLSKEDTLIGVFNDTRISFMFYEYKMLKEFIDFENISLASLEDIGCMKMDSISGRGTKRDFIDIYFILKNRDLKLEDLYDIYQQKYTGKDFNKVHLVKSLTYFLDAEKDPDPKMLVKFDWEHVKKYFLENRLEIEHNFGIKF